MREHTSINIKNKNNQTIVGSTMILMVFLTLLFTIENDEIERIMMRMMQTKE